MGEAGWPTAEAASPEAALFWAAASPWPDAKRVASLAATADLATVAAAAETHRVGPLVLAALRQAGVDLGRDAAFERLRAEAALRYTQERLVLPRALDLAVRPLRDAGMRPVVIKGPALVERYPAPGQRGMDDLDVVLDRRDHPRAMQLLEAAGWRRAAHRGRNADVPFRHPEAPGLPLELHRELETWSKRNSGLRAAALVRASVRRPVLGVEAHVLPAPLELVLLSVHAAKLHHVYNRLVWAVDLAIITRAEPIDWERVRRHAQDAGARTAVAVGMNLARRLGGDVPAEVTELGGRAARAGLLDPLLDPELPVRPLERRALAAVGMAEGMGVRARLVLGMARTARREGAWKVASIGRASVRWGWRLVRTRR